MPRGPRGEQRPAEVIGAAIMVARISVGDAIEPLKEPSGKARNGRAGAKARAEKFTPDKGREIARKAAAGRWR